jgi:hypothetical protein
MLRPTWRGTRRREETQIRSHALLLPASQPSQHSGLNTVDIHDNLTATKTLTVSLLLTAVLTKAKTGDIHR